MNTLQMHYFISIVENKTFSKAASINYISQPTLSKHIQNLENELGVTLFDRSKHPIELTDYGELYYRAFSNFFSEMNRIKGIYSKYDQSFKGSLSIGILSGWKLPECVARTFSSFHEKYPEIQLIFENHNIKHLIFLLHAGKLDTCLIMKDFISDHLDISSISLFNVPKYLIYSKEHFKSLNRKPEVIDMQTETFFTLYEDETDYTKTLVQNYCKPYGFIPITKSLPNIESVISNIEFGNGVTILDELNQIGNSEKISKIPVDPPHTLCLAWFNESNSPMLPLIIHEFKNAFL